MEYRFAIWKFFTVGRMHTNCTNSADSDSWIWQTNLILDSMFFLLASSECCWLYAKCVRTHTHPLFLFRSSHHTATIEDFNSKMLFRSGVRKNYYYYNNCRCRTIYDSLALKALKSKKKILCKKWRRRKRTERRQWRREKERVGDKKSVQSFYAYLESNIVFTKMLWFVLVKLKWWVYNDALFSDSFFFL